MGRARFLIVVTHGEARAEMIKRALDFLNERQLGARTVTWKNQLLLVTSRSPTSADVDRLKDMGVSERLVQSAQEAQLASREFQRKNSVINVGNASIGSDKLVVIAGPCSVESRQQLLEVARAVNRLGASMLRGGAFKPRTSPYEFQGLGESALRLLAEARDETGLPIITEVPEPSKVDLVAKYADMFQIGARNMQNFPLLKAVGKSMVPVLLKRGMMATIDEWLHAAEYILLEGNPNVVLCERGIRTFETATRNTLDLAAIPVLKKQTHLPTLVDPSHATGSRDLVIPMTKAAVSAGADGIIIEVHPTPESALSDSNQQLNLDEFRRLMEELEAVAKAVGRRVR
jgi:3-deoxy-7-phosphoheptulonate synthase